MNTLFEAVIPLVAANGYGRETAQCISVNKYLYKHPYLLRAVMKLKSTHYPWTGDTVIHHLAKRGFVRRLKDFIDIGVSLEQRDFNGDTPLLTTIRNIEPNKIRYYNTLQVLLDGGANPSADGTFMNILSTAVTYEDPVVVEMICKAGANPNILSDYEGKNMLSLMTGNRQTRMRFSPLAEAVIRNQLEIAKILLANGALLSNVTFDNSTTLLILAAKHNNVRIIEFLLDQGVDINEQNEFGTALHAAVKSRRFEAVECLVKYGADVNCIDQYNTTPLMIAVVDNMPKIAESLLNNGANTRIVQMGTNRTALQIAEHNNFPVLLCLLQNQ